jgi:hypothetical protein
VFLVADWSFPLALRPFALTLVLDCAFEPRWLARRFAQYAFIRRLTSRRAAELIPRLARRPAFRPTLGVRLLDFLAAPSASALAARRFAQYAFIRRLTSRRAAALIPRLPARAGALPRSPTTARIALMR